MRQQLWLLNSSLLITFVLVFSISWLIRKEAPIIKISPFPAKIIAGRKLEPTISKKQVENIYKNDLFDTYTEPTKPAEIGVSSIPEPKLPEAKAIPPEKKPELVPPLKIVLKGILYTTEPDQSASFITDETGKEGKYYLGDQIKDSQIIKIAKDRIVILRNNGQQETMYLRKEDNLMSLPTDKRWDGIVKKIDESNYQIDPIRFREEIKNLGMLLEILSPATTYIKGKPIGVQIGKLNKEELENQLGLKDNDIIIDINDKKITTSKERYKIFEEVKNLKANDIIKVSLKRNYTEIQVSYLLKHIEKISNNFFEQSKIEGMPKGGFVLNR